MRNVRAIAKKELASYFDSPVAYIVIGSFLLVAGWMFFSSFFLMERADMRTHEVGGRLLVVSDRVLRRWRD